MFTYFTIFYVHIIQHLCLKNYVFFRFFGVLDLGVPLKHHPARAAIAGIRPSWGTSKRTEVPKKSPEKPRDLPSGYLLHSHGIEWSGWPIEIDGLANLIA